jgi:hypothetical protein
MMLKHPPGFLEPAIQSSLLFRGLAKLDGRTNFLAVTPSRVTASLDDRADLLDGRSVTRPCSTPHSSSNLVEILWELAARRQDLPQYSNQFRLPGIVLTVAAVMLLRFARRPIPHLLRRIG